MPAFYVWGISGYVLDILGTYRDLQGYATAGPLFGSPYNKDECILGSIFSATFFWKLRFLFQGLLSEAPRIRNPKLLCAAEPQQCLFDSCRYDSSSLYHVPVQFLTPKRSDVQFLGCVCILTVLKHGKGALGGGGGPYQGGCFVKPM